MARHTAPIGAEGIAMSDETTTEEAVEAPETKPAKKAGPPEDWTPNPTATHRSLAAYVTEHSGVEITEEQACALLIFHKYWQADPARKAEREAEKQAKAEEKAKAELEALFEKFPHLRPGAAEPLFDVTADEAAAHPHGETF